ncbi:MAG: hypothetical protein RIB41_03540 [Oceanibaculum nanhaiense]|jgi:hypothetical protein|uniref:hypothetical protein n=1 Tax=Oceanibaculum nanhaiense TaxID=1909734 RepID=UPI0032EB17A6
MQEHDESWLDKDISSLDLSYIEKSGLQVYRNYQSSFEKHRINEFIDSVNNENYNLDELKNIIEYISSGEILMVPVFSCSFSDGIIKSSLIESFPEGIPGGKSGLFSGYGALSDFSKRIQMSYVFNHISKEILTDLNHLRIVRNKISHDWDFKNIKEFYNDDRIKSMYPVEDHLKDRRETEKYHGKIDDISAFRIRVIWLICMLYYECKLYYRAKQKGFDSPRVLYAEKKIKLLEMVSEIALRATIKVAKSSES